RHTRCYRDWSSDVCSSDLDQCGFCLLGAHLPAYDLERRQAHVNSREESSSTAMALIAISCLTKVKRAGVCLVRAIKSLPFIRRKIGRASCRERVRRQVSGG